jgi:copper homeostasis protein
VSALPRRPIVEACVETVDEARSAEAGGASRLELCANLAEGGTTPDEATVRAVVNAVAIPAFIMIRPRAGSFVYTDAELADMERQVVRAQTRGANGIVTGALTAADAIDVLSVRRLVAAAGPLPVTFHRAFDRVADRERALDTLATLGVARVLTSGGAPTALDGADDIARLVRQAAGRLIVVAAGGVRAHNVREVVARTGVAEIHAHLTAVGAVDAIVRAVTSTRATPEDLV